MEDMKFFLLLGKIIEIHTTKQAKWNYSENYQIHIIEFVSYGLWVGDYYIQKWPSASSLFQQLGIAEFLAFELPLLFDEESLAEFETFNDGWCVVTLLSLLVCFVCTFFGMVGWVLARISHGRAAIHLSFQLHPQFSLSRLYEAGFRSKMELALHCRWGSPLEWHCRKFRTLL